MSTTPEATIASYFDALNSGDPAAMANLFDEQGAFIGQGVPTAVGPDGIREFATRAFGAMRLRFDYDVDGVDTGDGLAVVRSRSAGTVTELPSEESHASAYRDLFVLRERDGRWLITNYIYNGDPAEAGR